MKKHLLIYLIIYSICSLAGQVRAQERFADRYNITYVTMNEGLPHNFIDDLYKDSRGFMWISTAGGGLSRYDGYEFVNYTPNNHQCKLKSNFIRNVCEDAFQRLWIVSEGGTDIIDLSTLKPIIPRDPKGILPKILELPATRIMKDTQGCIWLHCDNALHRIEFNDKGEVQILSTLSPVYLNGPDIALKDIDEDGKIWMGNNGEIRKVALSPQKRLITIPIADCLKFETGTYISDFLCKENEVWISSDRGLFRYNKSGNVIKRYEHDSGNSYSLSQNYLTSLAITSDKQLIVATLRGINIYKSISGSVRKPEVSIC